MRHYEVMVILDLDLEERAVSPLIENFLSVVREGNGKVEKVIPGRRRLAYEIKKKPLRASSVIDLQAEPAVVKELDRQMNLNESVLRTRPPVSRPTELCSSAHWASSSSTSSQQQTRRRPQWQARPSSRSSAILSTTPSCASPLPVRRSRSSASRPPPAPSTVRPMSGRTARACS